MNITTDLNSWSPSNNPNFLFRIDPVKNRLYRKELSPEYIGGFKILYVSLGTLLAKEWLIKYFD